MMEVYYSLYELSHVYLFDLHYIALNLGTLNLVVLPDVSLGMVIYLI